MKKKSWMFVVLTVVVMLIFCFSASAVTLIDLYSGSVGRDETVTGTFDQEFKFKYGDGSQYIDRHGRMTVSLPDDSALIVPVGNCKEQSVYKVCFDKVNRSIKPVDSDSYPYSAKVRVYGLIAEVEVGKTFSPASIKPYEITHVEVQINNSGSQIATNVIYEETIPGSVTLLNHSGECWRDGRRLYWNGDIEKGEKVECLYALKGIKPVTLKDDISVPYFNGFEEKTATTTSTTTSTLTVDDFLLRWDISLIPSSVHVGDKVNYSLELTNKHNSSDIHIMDLLLNFPDGLVPINATGLTGNETLQWEGKLAHGKSQKFTYLLRAEKLRTLTLVPQVDYVIGSIIGGKLRQSSTSSSLTVSADTLDINTGYEDMNGSLLLKTEVVNLNKRFFSNVAITITGPLLPEPLTQKIGLLPQLERRKIQQTIPIPVDWVNESTSLDVTVTHNWYEEILSSKKTVPVSLNLISLNTASQQQEQTTSLVVEDATVPQVSQTTAPTVQVTEVSKVPVYLYLFAIVIQLFVIYLVWQRIRT